MDACTLKPNLSNYPFTIYPDRSEQFFDNKLFMPTIRIYVSQKRIHEKSFIIESTLGFSVKK